MSPARMNPQPGRTLLLQTYDGWDVPNSIDAELSTEAEWYYRRGNRIGNQAQELAPPTGRYNCHGLVFASRRTNIPPAGGPDSVTADDLLNRDEYEQIHGPPQPGDVVVYRDHQNQEATHSGLVSRIDRIGSAPVINVISKWGAGPEYEHHQQSCPYVEGRIEYWRLKA